MSDLVGSNPLSEVDVGSETDAVLTLEANLVGEAGGRLAEQFTEFEAGSLAVNASAVERVDTPAIQVLLSAQKLWSERGLSFKFNEISPVVQSAFLALGLNQHLPEEF